MFGPCETALPSGLHLGPVILDYCSGLSSNIVKSRGCFLELDILSILLSVGWSQKTDGEQIKHAIGFHITELKSFTIDQQILSEFAVPCLSTKLPFL